MMLRLLFSMIVGLGLLLSPVTMAGGGVAMAHTAAAETIEADRHCHGSEAPEEESSEAGKSSCAAACAALAPLLPAAQDPGQLANSRHEAPLHRMLVGIHPEGETPPPRSNPET